MKDMQQNENMAEEKLSSEEGTKKVSEKQTKEQLFWEIFRFLLVGGTATIADYLVFWLFDGWLLPLLPVSGKAWTTISLIISTAAGFGIGLVVNWILSVRFVFRAVKDKEEASSKKSFFVFTVIGLIGLAITEVGVVILVAVLPEITLFGTTAFFRTEWSKWVAKVIMTCIVLVFNYTGRKLLIFKS